MPTLTRADRAHLNRAIEIAKTSTCRQRHGAVLASGRRVLGVGVNSFRSHPNHVSDPKRHASFHAEVAVLRQIGYAGDGKMSLYVARVLRDDSPALSLPCALCREEIRKAGIKTVVFTTETGFGVMT